MRPNIYILCIANLRTGGPEALHQLCYYMIQVGFNAYMVYFNAQEGVDPMPPEYAVYGLQSKKISEIEDIKQNVLICAESSSVMLNGYKHIQKYMWWLSVNWSDYNPLPFTRFITHKVKRLLGIPSDISCYCNYKLKDCIHVCGSKYAYEHCLKIGIQKPLYLVEPISKVFYENQDTTHYDRDNVILYNPAKPSDIMTRLLEDKRFQFKALTKMNTAELMDAYKHAKLYIDFGHFGGPERMPKEAVYFGCAILVGKRNAAVNDFDVAIPNEYKIEQYNEIDIVNDKIAYMLEHYDRCIKDFLPFKRKVTLLEETFKEQILQVFNHIK